MVRAKTIKGGASTERHDVLSPEQRWLCMSQNRGRDTGPEVALRKQCWALGMRYVLKAKVTGKPDFLFPRAKVAVFVDGCFWHGCPEHYTAPKTRFHFWRQKLMSNQRRDAQVNAELQASGWKVVRFWEHDLDDEASLTAHARSIQRVVQGRKGQ